LEIDQRLLAAEVINRNCITIRDGDEELVTEVAEKSNVREPSLDGKLDTKEKLVQTLDVYHLTAEMVYHEIETKVRNYVRDLYDPLEKSHGRLQTTAGSLSLELERVRKDLADIKQTIRNANPQREFQKVMSMIESNETVNVTQ
jgi:hypothetical protein